MSAERRQEHAHARLRGHMGASLRRCRYSPRDADAFVDLLVPTKALLATHGIE